jgi:thiamine-phosphate pyrophosphorylase
MRVRQTCPAPKGTSLPFLWLLSDARNDAALEAALTRLPRGSGFVFRHYHLRPEARRARWHALRRLAHACGHLAIYAGPADEARALGADGVYGARGSTRAARGLLTLATAHDLAELAGAFRRGADAILLSPVFPTRSHPGAATLGPLRFRLLARRAGAPVIALGGMTTARARRLRWPRWAAIDGLA